MTLKASLMGGLFAGMLSSSAPIYADEITQVYVVNTLVKATFVHELGGIYHEFANFLQVTAGLGLLNLTGVEWQWTGVIGTSFSGVTNYYGDTRTATSDFYYAFGAPSATFAYGNINAAALCSPGESCGASASVSQSTTIDVADFSNYLDGFIVADAFLNLTPACITYVVGNDNIGCGTSFGSVLGTLSLTYVYDVLVPPPSIPEPTTLALLGLGFAGLGFSRRKH